MKKTLIIALLFVSVTVFGKGGGGGHSSGSHASESSHSSSEESFHNSSEETQTSRHTISDEDIHYNGTRMAYYYLLLNHSTSKYDTVYAGSKEELKSKVSGYGNGNCDGKYILIVFGVVLIILLLIAFFS